jgi:competence protein ComEA
MKNIRILLVFICFISIISGVLLLQDHGNTKALEIPIHTESKPIKVYISGAITNPGVYLISSESIMGDLIATAGGLHISADLEYVHKNLNLASSLTNGQQVYIQFKGEGQEQSSSVSVDGKININTATSGSLETLAGVGPATAEKIIQGRPYAKVEDLMNVSGIGQASFDKIKMDIYVGN